MNKFPEIDFNNKPEDVAISTITLTCNVKNIIFNLENIAQYIELTPTAIVSTNLKNERTILKKKKRKPKKQTKQKNFYNQVTIKMKTDIKRIINIKLFRNGSIQITGCLDTKHTIMALEKMFKIFKKDRVLFDFEKNEVRDIEFVDNKTLLELSNVNKFKIALINSNFNIGFRINRSKLYATIINKLTGVEYTYDPIGHAGVILKYVIENVTVTVLIFESGSIVITGAKTCKHINEVYTKVNIFLLENYYQIANIDYSSIIERYL